MGQSEWLGPQRSFRVKMGVLALMFFFANNFRTDEANDIIRGQHRVPLVERVDGYA